MFRPLWQHRHFICATIRGEFKVRVTRSYFGAAWFILQPMAQGLIFTLVLSEVLGARLPQVDNKSAYAMFVLSGLAAWGLFSEILNRCLTIFIDHSASIKKIAFPRLCLPLIVLGSALLNHAMVLLATIILFAGVGHYPGWAWLSLPLGIVLIAAFAFGIGIIVGVFNVFSRGVGQVVAIILQVWFWLTPIVYPVGTLPARFSWITDLNPLAPVVAIYQQALLNYEAPPMMPLLAPILIALTLVIFAIVLFRRASSDLVDAL